MEQRQLEAIAIASLKGGDIGGLEVLVQLHQTQAMRTAYLLCQDQYVAEDVVADVFLVVYERIAQYDASRPFAPWLYRIVVTTTLRAMRRQRKYVTGDLATTALGHHGDHGALPEATVVGREMNNELAREINALPVKLRTVLVLRHYLDMDERTIADTLEIPVGTVKSRLHAARQGLRRSVSRWIDTAQQQKGNIA